MSAAQDRYNRWNMFRPKPQEFPLIVLNVGDIVRVYRKPLIVLDCTITEVGIIDPTTGASIPLEQIWHINGMGVHRFQFPFNQ